MASCSDIFILKYKFDYVLDRLQKKIQPLRDNRINDTLDFAMFTLCISNIFIQL